MDDPLTPQRYTWREEWNEADLRRVWRRIQDTSAKRSRWGWRPALLVAACAVALLLGWVGLVGLPRGESPLVARAHELVVASSPGAILSFNAEFSDGSRVELLSGTTLEVLENDGHVFRTALRTGGGEFSVQPGGPRKWVVECAGVAVEVVGTRFRLSRGPGKVHIEVLHGAVLVRGERVPDYVARLGEGQRLEIPTEEAIPAVPSGTTATPGTLVPEEGQAATPASSPSMGSAQTAPLASASRAPKSDLLDRWLREADAARLAGDSVTAKGLLFRVVREAGSDPRGAMAAFALARLQVGREPAAAAETLEKALGRGVPRGMEEDTWARLAESYARSGKREQARRAAREYLRRFPDGVRAAEVRRWAEASP